MDSTDHMFARAMRVLALATFLISTLIFLLCYYWRGGFLLFGVAFVVAVGVVNLSLFAITLSMGLKQRNTKLLISAVMMILNGPIVAVYVWLLA